MRELHFTVKPEKSESLVINAKPKNIRSTNFEDQIPSQLNDENK